VPDGLLQKLILNSTSYTKSQSHKEAIIMSISNQESMKNEGQPQSKIEKEEYRPTDSSHRINQRPEQSLNDSQGITTGAPEIPVRPDGCLQQEESRDQAHAKGNGQEKLTERRTDSSGINTRAVRVGRDNDREDQKDRRSENGNS
jgi:hypothetical protein